MIRPLCYETQIERRCILFPLIMLELFLQLDWSTPMVNSIDLTWKGTHSWQYMQEQKPSQMNNILFVTCAEYNRCGPYREVLTYKPLMQVKK